MSAWMVSKLHIDYVVTAAVDAELIPERRADATGRMLWHENLRSVAYRYPGDVDCELRDSQIEAYRWSNTPVLSGGALAKTLGCYRYQACEHPEWKKSQANQLVVRLWPPDDPEYDESTPWGW